MPKSPPLTETFTTLREVLAAQSDELVVTVDRPGEFRVASATMQDGSGQPLVVAGVRARKHYVSYFLMPVYAAPRLVQSLSPELKKRMHGLSCFNFTSIDPSQIKELSRLTRAGIEAFRDVPLPWAPQERRPPVVARTLSRPRASLAPRSPQTMETETQPSAPKSAVTSTPD